MSKIPMLSGSPCRGAGEDGADIGAAGPQRGDLGADVEVLGLNADHFNLR